MKKIFLNIFLLFGLISSTVNSQTWIRVNQLGYLPEQLKVAVLISKNNILIENFELRHALTDEVVFTSDDITNYGVYLNFTTTYRLNFSEFKNEGAFYIQVKDSKSPVFRINNSVYDGTADLLLNYMRQQRCGFNPFLNDSCHKHDGFIIYHPTLDSTHIDVTGGWHDASDYLQYVTTSANATYQMLFAYQQNPGAYKDNYLANGLLGKNGIPDILDEAKWGLDWLLKMNPEKGMMFNQIADDRDHQGFRLPTLDLTSYGKEFERPVYYCTGQPQGVFKHKNRTTGIASTAGKYASAFALGSELLKPYYPEFCKKIRQKSFDAYQYGLNNPGVCQTAPCRAPYFYEEDNWFDDMQLAAVSIYNLSKDEEFLTEAKAFGNKEKIIPWMGSDTVRHYQWYPFVNLGHYLLAKSGDTNFTNYLKQGLEKIYQKGKKNTFQIGIPFIWCSNNLIAAALTQSKLYFNLTGDNTFQEMEAALRDWLFGCNPWGTSMIVGLPSFGDYPDDIHSALTHHHGYRLDGALVDGPIYASIFSRLIGLTIYNGDEYEEFQSDFIVYHDDYGDYSTNEPTMDGTASLSYYLSALEMDGNKFDNSNNIKHLGGITRFDTTKKNIYLAFTGHEYSDGGEIIKSVLKKHNIKASFFFTGDFYRNSKNKILFEQLIEDGHYLGAHSDKHLLYATWEDRDSLLVTKEQFINDLKNNFKEMNKFGIKESNYFLPPYEWYNRQICDWCNEYGITLINYSSGTLSTADYTYPRMEKRYIDSEKIYNSILDYEKEKGLNGFILLLHIGTNPEREDKFYFKLNSILLELEENGYNFSLFP
ncbi:MAG: glycoside hydrolase family 9 protein [Ignavibacteriales bacterium]|nr:glycoside hydrolase family 9 protein [Ignavibacteriales bacterium]